MPLFCKSLEQFNIGFKSIFFGCCLQLLFILFDLIGQFCLDLCICP